MILACCVPYSVKVCARVCIVCLGEHRLDEVLEFIFVLESQGRAHQKGRHEGDMGKAADSTGQVWYSTDRHPLHTGNGCRVWCPTDRHTG